MGTHKHYGQVNPGDITTPRARVYSGVTQSIPNDTATTINWELEAFDADGLHSTVTNPSRLTLNRAGAWLINAQVTFSSTTAMGRRFAFLQRNGVEFTRVLMPPISANLAYVAISGVIAAAVNDYVTLVALHDSGVGLTTVPNDGGSIPFGFLQATYLGA